MQQLDNNKEAPDAERADADVERARRRASLLKRCRQLTEHRADPQQRLSRDAFRDCFQSQEFLDLFFELFDVRGSGALQQDDWIDSLKARLSDEKQLELAEAIETAAYAECGKEPITPVRFRRIFNARGICSRLFRLLDCAGAGSVSSEQAMALVAAISESPVSAGFDREALAALETLFRQTVGPEGEIKLEDFKKIVVSKNPFFTERVFQIFDKDKSGSISLQEFLDAMHKFAGKSPDDKIHFLFSIYDMNEDGRIEYTELQNVMRMCMTENGMEFSDEQIEDLTMAMFEDADVDSRGEITFEALKRQLESHGGMLENLSITIDRWLVPPQAPAPAGTLMGRLLELRPYQLTKPYWRNNYVYLTFLAVYLLVNLGLFIARTVEFLNKENPSGYLAMARACGQCLNFNCMFVLVLMLRHCITFLRTRGFGCVLPLDNHIYLHKLVGVAIAFFSAFHTVAHLCNFSLVVVNSPQINTGNWTTAEWLLTARPGIFGLVPGWANPTGFVLCLILVVMVVCSQPFVRRGGSFEVFYWTHLLYVPFWTIVVLHAPNFWKWFVGPGLLYVLERAIRFAYMRSERGKTYISCGLLLPSKVIRLVIKRPPGFTFHPGDYVFVNIPAIAKYEWHPFTVSTAPELEGGQMWLHVRAVGEWTNRLYDYFEAEQERLHSGEVQPLSQHNQGVVVGGGGALRKLQSSLKRQFSGRAGVSEVQLVGYHSQERDAQPVSVSDGEINNRATSSNEMLNYPGVQKKIPTEKRLQMLLFNQKVPLEKSLSMPDIQTKTKKKQRLLVLREYMRSESEKSFDECQIRRARLQSLGLAYLSPQNKSLAQSFKYMRTKPTIIAFKTPSLENCDARISSSSFGSDGSLTSPGSVCSPGAHNPERRAEEGHSPFTVQLKPMNYPVGKPLEPIQEDKSAACSDEANEPLLPFKNRKIMLQNDKQYEIYLDGPYGAPSSHIFQAQHAVLIATGIGVTPFASILQSIMIRYWKARHECPECHHVWASNIPSTVMNLKKVDFFWINRNQRSFEWIVNLLSQLEIEQAELGNAMERFLEMHMYITSALQKTDMKAVGLQLALDLLHKKEKRDLVTGLKTRTNAGRPNWDKVFKQLQDQNKGKVTVFYCGKPEAGRVVRYKCDQYGFTFRKEIF